MRKTILAAVILLCPALAWAQSDQQSVVDRAALAVQEVVGNPPSTDVLDMLQRSRAVLICPQLFKAGFFIGGEGGNCVLLARDGAGSWSAPAFYGMGSGSFGFQFGIQDAELLLTILTEKGLNAVLDSQFKIGADASVAVATLGGGLQGATSAALGADIVAFERTRGLFAGVSLAGSVLSSQSGNNNAYYGRALGARQIVVQMEANNPGADPLRAVLMRFGGKSNGMSYGSAQEPINSAPPPREAPYSSGGAARPGSVSSQSLPPPR